MSVGHTRPLLVDTLTVLDERHHLHKPHPVPACLPACRVRRSGCKRLCGKRQRGPPAGSSGPAAGVRVQPACAEPGCTVAHAQQAGRATQGRDSSHGTGAPHPGGAGPAAGGGVHAGGLPAPGVCTAADTPEPDGQRACGSHVRPAAGCHAAAQGGRRQPGAATTTHSAPASARDNAYISTWLHRTHAHSQQLRASECAGPVPE